MAEMNWFQLFKMNILFGLLLVLYDWSGILARFIMMTQHWWYKGTVSQQLCAGLLQLWLPVVGLSALKDTQTDKWVIM